MSAEELAKIAENERESRKSLKYEINVCVAGGCLSSHSDALIEAFRRQVKSQGLEHQCRVKGVGCLGLCAQAPLVSIGKKNILYHTVTPGDVPEIVDSLDTKPIKRLQVSLDSPFFNRQTKIVLDNCGQVDPERIEDYIEVGGYSALAKTLNEMTPTEVTEQVRKSGLRGRGGAGYPTGLKWSTVSRAVGAKKFVVCNADEGDPGAFMDRTLLASDPHKVLEGMIIAAYAIGASDGFIYVRAE
ncbi:MAG TPA: NAD(P)H-dependent oxidoreductase subunit E, partial [Candidatus Bathyarchaeia archaeon]|nr:NAD(P)H-dependent oxidoreductase subunit E [Candidatus Bathyarchaeia archaeon]